MRRQASTPISIYANKLVVALDVEALYHPLNRIDEEIEEVQVPDAVQKHSFALLRSVK